MELSKPAIIGGTPVRKKPFPRYNTIGDEEKKVVMEILDTGVLSEFYGSNVDRFWGGKYVRSLEKQWTEFFDVKHSLSFNSATSGLIAAVGALGIGPGDEVIVSPYTMSASGTSILFYNAIPVFVDIEDDYFCIDADKIEKSITPHTKAIIAVHLFGQPADMTSIMEIARKHDLSVIEDAAQSPGAMQKNRYTGTIGDIGVFSLNCHKAIQTGEGGMCVTNNPELAKRLALIRNHAEAVIAGGMEVKDPANMIGYNFRLTELQAAIGRIQLEKLEEINRSRQNYVDYINRMLGQVDGIHVPAVRDECTHVYYNYNIQVDEEVLGLPRDLLVRVLQAEGIPVWSGYVKPLYLYPLYSQGGVYGKVGCPFSCTYYKGLKQKYAKGLCPVTESVNDKIICMQDLRGILKEDDLKDVGVAYYKVVENKEKILNWAKLNTNNKQESNIVHQ